LDTSFNLEGKTALITGASRGIGEAIARRFAEQGATVVCTSRKLEGCEAVAASIREAGGKAEARACHIGDVEAIQRTAWEADEANGGIDILVNNAAANPYFGHVLDTDLAAFEKTVDVNIRGYFFMSTAIGQLMRKRGEGGVILNVASVDGIRPGMFRGVYSITKAAIIQMTKAFARECAMENIRVNALLPGLTETRFASALTQNPDIAKAALEHIPMDRFASPDEMSGAALFLCSGASSYATGACLEVDGGFLLV
jgi:NAD(P)-dependent dehydrogenase (short-subunit alcohol dehydrogenase family)